MGTLLPLLCLCCVVILLTGCVNPFEPDIVLPTMAPTPATVPSPITQVPLLAPDIAPRPTSVLPPIYNISIRIGKNPIATNPRISVIYEGSGGLVLPAKIETTVIRSDGVTDQKFASNPPRGTQLLLNGTTGTDRVIVNVTYPDGSTFTVRDELVPIKSNR